MWRHGSPINKLQNRGLRVLKRTMIQHEGYGRVELDNRHHCSPAVNCLLELLRCRRLLRGGPALGRFLCALGQHFLSIPCLPCGTLRLCYRLLADGAACGEPAACGKQKDAITLLLRKRRWIDRRSPHQVIQSSPTTSNPRGREVPAFWCSFFGAELLVSVTWHCHRPSHGQDSCPLQSSLSI